MIHSLCVPRDWYQPASRPQVHRIKCSGRVSIIMVTFFEPSGILYNPLNPQNHPKKQALSLSHFIDVKTKAQASHLSKSHSL